MPYDPADPLAGKVVTTGLTFDDVLVLPGASDVIPSQVDTSSRLTRELTVRIPLLSSPMDTVTEARMAIAMARQGGIGVLHRNLPPEDQAAQVDLVKRSEAGMVAAPITCGPDATIAEADELMGRFRISGVPVTDTVDGREGVLVGIVTNRDIRFETDYTRRVGSVMTPMPLVTGPVGISGDDAMGLLARHKIEKLPLVDDLGVLRGLITVKDFRKVQQYPLASKDGRGRLLAGAAVGVGDDAFKRAQLLVDAGVDLLVVDTAHGHASAVLDTVRRLKKETSVQVAGGNVATYAGALALVDAGADAVKVGVGPGCFAAGTRVLMADGTQRDIETLQAGDRVIGGSGRPTTVMRAWCTGVREVVAVRHTASALPTYATADHRFLTGDLTSVATATVSSRGHVQVLDRATRPGAGKIGWQEIGQVDRSVLLAPRHVALELPETFTLDLHAHAVRHGRQLARYETVIEASEDLGFLIGTFLGAGHAFVNPVREGTDRESEIGRVSWSVGAHDTELTDRFLDAAERVTGVRPTDGGTSGGARHLHLHSLQWARLLSACGQRDDRHLPAGWLCSDPRYLTGLLDGLVASAGHSDQAGRICFRSTSRALAELFGLLCLLVHGSLPHAEHAAPSAGGRPGVDDADCLPSYRSRLSVAHRARQLAEHNVVTLVEVRETGLSVPVYDIEVEDDDHSFVADGVVVHNSICTTRVVAGVGVPQITAIAEAVHACAASGVPVIADGGVQYSGDIVKAIAVGASTVMLGSLLAGAEESPGELLFVNGKQFKSYRGMGSLGAMQSRGKASGRAWSRDRYAQDDVLSDDKLVPEGIEGQVPYRGALAAVVYQLVGGLQAGMGFAGTPTIDDLREHGRLVRITSAGLKESHPHDIQMTVEAPNYQGR